MTLTATESAALGKHVAGTVQFKAGATNIGAPVAVDARGVATANTTFSTAGKEVLEAQFTPTSASYRSSTGSFSLAVRAAGPPVAGIVEISVMVPQTGLFTVAIGSGPAELTPSGSTATGRLPEVTVTDTRNYYPGWSLSGQASRFKDASTGQSVSANQLGWVPIVVGSLRDGARLGRPVEAEPPGLGSDPATLAYAVAGCGFGTNTLSAKLSLDIPPTVRGRYSGTVTITYVESLAASTADDRATCSPARGDR